VSNVPRQRCHENAGWVSSMHRGQLSCVPRPGAVQSRTRCGEYLCWVPSVYLGQVSCVPGLHVMCSYISQGVACVS
jgi:hypothetical protein